MSKANKTNNVPSAARTNKGVSTEYGATQNSPVIFSFFSGSGFLDLGFESEGFDVAFVNEISLSFLSAYKYSRAKMGMPTPKYGYYNLDINDFLNGRKEELRRLVEETRNSGRLVGFIGGPPSPDFSIAGKNKGSNGLNGKLSLAYVTLIADIMPDFFLFENVKGLWSTARHRAYFDELKSKLHKVGYSTSERLCNALEFGVPQDRERVLFFGVKSELLTVGAAVSETITAFPWEQFTKYNAEEIKRLPWSGTNDFGDDITPSFDETKELLTVQYWFDKNDVENHPNGAAHFTPRGGIEKMRTVPEGDVSRKSYKRLHRYRYSPTAAYGNNEVHLHPYKARRISAAEAMAIQSLPKDFELPPDMTLSDMFKTIGNGVPFLLSDGIAKTIRVFLEDNVCKK
ncbi:restriction endonuclease subunit M [Clostridia bacterium]|nr:restriction endonuclease subunit M [Clostridia bacterium]